MNHIEPSVSSNTSKRSLVSTFFAHRHRHRRRRNRNRNRRRRRRRRRCQTQTRACLPM